MHSYTLSITIENQLKIQLTGNQVSREAYIEKDQKDMVDIASLFYGKEWTQEAENLFEKIEKKYLTNLGHHYSHYSLFIKSLGQYLFDSIIPPEIGKNLQNIPKNSTIGLELDNTTSAIPWELVHTKRNFLCLDYALNRSSSKKTGESIPFQDQIPMLLVADPTGDLYGAQIEANTIINQVQGSRIRVARYGGEITKAQYLALIKSGAYQLIHYSGHSESSSEPGLSHHKFKDGHLYGQEIESLSKYGMPTLVFSNSCQSAESSLNYDDSGNTSLAGSYLEAGVKSCIAAIWSVSDIGAAKFSADFYRYLMFNNTIGEALLAARRDSFRKWGLQDFIWGSYLFYGDPNIAL